MREIGRENLTRDACEGEAVFTCEARAVAQSVGVGGSNLGLARRK